MKMKRWKLLALSLFMMLSVAACSQKQSDEEMQKQFDEFIQNDFVESMEDDYLSMHIYMEHPENYGVKEENVTVQIAEKFEESQFEENEKELNELVDTFATFDRSQLTPSQQDTYDCYKYLIDVADKGNNENFRYLGSSFNTMTGDHTQIPTLFADMVLRNEKDVQNLITLVNDVKPYLESDLAYTQKQVEAGTLMIGLDEVIERCQEIVDAGMEGSTLTSMKSNVDALDLSPEKKEMYQKELEEAYQNSFLPGYETVIETLSAIDPNKNHTSGLANLEHGKEYYEVLFQQATGVDKTVEEVKKELESDADSALRKAQMIAFKNQDAYNDYFEGNEKTQYQDYAAMLKDLEQMVKEDFPDVGTLEYNIEPLAKDLATGGIAAYFNIPAMDGTTKKEMRVNDTQRENINSLDTFSTVAHEGIPGHMYQTQYMYNNIKTPWRLACANFSGYTEGYATYVELYSLKYVDANEDVKALQEIMSIYENYLIALTDIGIHYEGWSLEDLKSFFEKKGLNAEAAEPIYNQIVYNPTSFLSYYVGYQQIIDLKEKAQDELGDKFDDLGFHTALLESGTAPFSLVEQHIDAYIKDNK